MGHLGGEMEKQQQTGHFRAKSMCYSRRFHGWAMAPGVSWAKNRPRHARETGERPCIARSCCMVHLGGQTGKTVTNGVKRQQTGHFQEKSVCYSLRFYEWARALSVPWVENRLRCAREAEERPCVAHHVGRSIWVVKRVKRLQTRTFGPLNGWNGSKRGIFKLNRCAIAHDFIGGPSLRTCHGSKIDRGMPGRLWSDLVFLVHVGWAIWVVKRAKWQQTGHFRAKSMCYSLRFCGWAQAPGIP
ncbi:hypothetical protein BC332_08349 [Capsicum chinense]|nr:hypothetical protein BC332_08349 [Capsicum chinense]